MTPDKLQQTLFIDIETVPQTEYFNQLPEEIQHLWEDKFTILQKRMPEKYEDILRADRGYETSAGIYAEFGKIVCISVGYIYFNGGIKQFRTKSFVSDNERLLLENFSLLVQQFFKTPEYTFCGHNIKEFDIPFICRRMLINGLQLPPALQIHNKKPWELNFIDTMDYWKFGDYKNFTSLKLLATIFEIPTPKDDIDGSQVADVYYKEKNLERISRYCEKDVVATAQVWLKMNNLSLIKSENIHHV
ncbi:MAG: 3'-5' exonuclease [Paludibacteraceae bacterium]